jgi:hypothetical protein
MMEYTREHRSDAVFMESVERLLKSKSRVETESHNGIHFFESTVVATTSFVGRKERMWHRTESGREVIVVGVGTDDNRCFLEDLVDIVIVDDNRCFFEEIVDENRCFLELHLVVDMMDGALCKNFEAERGEWLSDRKLCKP